MSIYAHLLITLSAPILVWASFGFFYSRALTNWPNFGDFNNCRHYPSKGTLTEAGTVPISSPTALQLYFFGLGGIHALIVFPNIWALNQDTLTQEVQMCIAIFFCIIVLCVRSGIREYSTDRVTVFSRTPVSLASCCKGTLILVTLISALVICVTYLTAPIEAWDALQYWCERALVLLGESIDVSSVYFAADQRHPDTGAALLAWTSSTQLGSPISTSKLPWGLATVSISLMCYGFTTHLTENRVAGTIVTIVCLTLPLLENHIHLVGYAEIWLVGAFLGASTFFVLALESRSGVLLLLSIVFTVICTQTKNTWPAYIVPFWSAALFALCYNVRSTKFKEHVINAIRFLVISFLVLLALLQHEVSIFNRSTISQFLATYLDSLNLLGYAVSVELRAPSVAFSGLATTFIYDQSFSLSGLLIATLFCSIFCRSSHLKLSTAAFSLIAFVIFFTFEILTGQLFLPMLYQASLPGANTSFSRLLIPLAVMSVVTVAIIFSPSRPEHTSTRS